jgi:ABC-type multidrug transport system permease subunit
LNTRAVVFLAREDLRLMLRSKETWLWVFLMPVVFFYFMGTMQGGSAKPPGVTDDLLLVGRDGGVVADELARRLAEQDFRVERAEQEPAADVTRSDARRVLLPDRLTDALLRGEPQRLQLRGGGSGVAADHDEVRLKRAMYTVLADLFVLRSEGREPTAAAFRELAESPRSLTLEVRPAGRRREVPRGFQQAVPGTLVMFTALVLLTSGASLLVIERRRGLLARLATAPLSRTEVVLGKLGGKLGLGLLQIAFSLVVGTFLFGVDWGGRFPSVAVVLAVYGLFVSALGLCLGNLARTEGQAVGIGVLAANLLAALGGCWWPIEVTPGWMQGLAKLLPTGWVMSALHELTSFGLGPGAVVDEVLLLLLATAAALWVGARTFRFR